MGRKKLIIKRSIFVGIFFAVFGSGFLVATIWSNSVEANKVRYPLVAKRAQIENPSDHHINFSPLRTNLESYLETLGNSSDKVSIYFEYLPTGVSININENNESVAASLMKVPIIMTLFRAASEGQVDLDKKVVLKQEWLNDEYGSLYKKGVGYQLTIREAAKLAMVDSDNTAILLIFDQLNGLENKESSVISFLDLEFDVNSDERVLISARSYSSIMKCLYFACYNSKEDSQEILSYLTQSTFNNRLKLLLPDDLLVAHKIGTFFTKFQSDCGIVYLPNKNYVLCVMVEGQDPEASKIIAGVSNKVYTHVSSKIQPNN